MNIAKLSALIATALLAAACQQKIAPPVAVPAAQPPAASQAWTQYVDGFLDRYFAAQPPAAVSEGRHEFDGKLPDWSVDGIHKEIARLHAEREQAAGFTDTTLNATQRFERDYVLSRIDVDLFWLETVGAPFHNPSYYFDNGLDPGVYLSRPYAPLEQRLRAFIAYAQAIPNATRQIRANLQSPLPKTFITYGIAGFQGFSGFYRNDVPTAFADVKDIALQKELRDAIVPAAASMDEMVKWLKSEQPKATDDFALGPERFARMLKMTELVTTPLAQLKAAGQADLDRNLAALKDACTLYLPNGTVAQCVRKVTSDKPAGSVVDEASQQLQALRQFIIDKSIVSIPGAEQVLVRESPPYQRQNSAFIQIPGPYEKGLASIYYYSPPDPAWSKADQRAFIPGKSDLLFTSIHEVWPGHFLQFLHSNRSPFKFGEVFVGYAFAEGWAHYSEEMMWEQGYGNQAPDVHIGQLLNALLRNVRFMCAIGLHTEGMKVEECQRMFAEQAMSDPGNARQQAARGTYDPAYLNYTLGKLMIRKLRSDWLAKRGGDATLHDFHDAFLSYGGPPIPLVRAQMLPGDNGSLF